jgi:hypothetical protein
LVTDADHICKTLLQRRANVLGLLPGNVDANLFHGVDGERIERNGLHGRANRLNLVLRQCSHKTLSHFAAFGMARAQKQHSWFIPHASPIENGRANSL